MTNSKRLKAIESLVPNGTRLLDIGSDHGLLPIALFALGRITGAVLTDINKQPLAHAVANAAAECPDMPVESYLSDGFVKVPSGCYSSVAICGMGGELIARIIEEGGDKAKGITLALQPMTMEHKLREYLWSNGFDILKELYVCEGRRCYVALQAEYTGNPAAYTKEQCYLGKHRPNTAEYKAYAEKIKTAAKNRLHGATATGDTAAINAEQALLSECDKVLAE